MKSFARFALAISRRFGSATRKALTLRFACVAARRPEVAIKTDSIETAEMLIAAGVGHRAAYMHRSWISLPLDAAPDELEHRLVQAYRIIRSGLPRKVEAGLAPLP